jgi:hypothetical protein
MIGRVSLLAVLTLAGCNSAPPPCPEPEKVYPATGAGAVLRGSGELVSRAEDQRIAISADRQFLEYTFTRDGTTFTARYALSETRPARARKYVLVRRSNGPAPCGGTALGPVIDSIEVKRGGAVISTGRSFFASNRCGEGLTNKASPQLNGPPDGQGTALAGSDLGWALDDRTTLVSGDQVVVTVLDASREAFDVYAGGDQASFDVKLGTLTATGTVVVP